MNAGSNGPSIKETLMFTGVVTVSTLPVVDGELSTNAVCIAYAGCRDCSV